MKPARAPLLSFKPTVSLSIRTVVCKLALLGSQPSCGERSVGKDEDAYYCDTNSDNTLYIVSLGSRAEPSRTD